MNSFTPPIPDSAILLYGSKAPSCLLYWTSRNSAGGSANSASTFFQSAKTVAVPTASKRATKVNLRPDRTAQRNRMAELQRRPLGRGEDIRGAELTRGGSLYTNEGTALRETFCHKRAESCQRQHGR